MPEIGWFFCCLNPTERGVLREMGHALPVTLFLGVPFPLWDAMWLVSGGDTVARREAFLGNFGLEIATIMVGDPPVPVDVVRPLDVVQWADYSVFTFLPAAACLSGCAQSKLPWQT